MRQPYLGDRVYAWTDPTSNNGSMVCAADVTRVWGQAPDGCWTVNIRLTKDGPAERDEWKTSVKLYPSHEAALSADAGPSSCWWPWPTEDAEAAPVDVAPADEAGAEDEADR